LTLTSTLGSKHVRTLGALLFLLATGLFAADRIVWKPIPNAILQVDARAPKLWNLFQPGKKLDPLLIQIGSRYLVVYIRNKEIYEIKPEQLERKGETLLWRESDKPASPIATSGWSTKDVGSATRTLVKLAEEGSTLDIQTPKMPDLRRGIY
jgi:hypothetical protein